jgi:hypothetical protein
LRCIVDPLTGYPLFFCYRALLLLGVGGVDSAVLLRTLLPRQPVDGVDASGSAGAIVAASLLDTAYQLK